jgi:putative FmdB family regulatory protein
MPTYSYECARCGKKFTLHTTIADHDRHKTECPKCGRRKLQQRVQGFFAVTAKKS